MRIGIVGAGISGLTLHRALSRRGIDSVVLEAASEPGGMIQSVHRKGRVLELGPQRTRLTPGVRDLVANLGLRDELLEATDRPLYVYRDGRLRRVPKTMRAAVTTDLLSWRGKIRTLAEPMTGPPRDGENVREFIARTLGTEVADYLAGPLYAGLYASDPHEMPVEHSLAKALDRLDVSQSLLLTAVRKALTGRDGPPVVSFDDGLARLPESLYADHQSTVHLDTPVESVRDREPGFTVHTRGPTEYVDRVVFTTPADVTARLVDRFAPKTASKLRTLTYNPLAVVHLHATDTLNAAGYQIPLTEEFDTRGVTCNAALFDRDGVYTCFVGGATTPGVVDWSDERLQRVAIEEFELITGLDATPIHCHRLHRGMPAYDQSWDALDGLTLPDGVHICANYAARAGIPGRVREARTLAATIAAKASPDDGGMAVTADPPGRERSSARTPSDD